MIESAAGSKVNLDDEDPDMSDWSDYGEQEGGPGGLEDDLSFDDDDFLDFVSDSNSDASTENEDDTSNVFVNAEEYESRYSENHDDDSKHFSRKKRRKT